VARIATFPGLRHRGSADHCARHRRHAGRVCGSQRGADTAAAVRRSFSSRSRLGCGSRRRPHLAFGSRAGCRVHARDHTRGSRRIDGFTPGDDGRRNPGGAGRRRRLGGYFPAARDQATRWPPVRTWRRYQFGGTGRHPEPRPLDAQVRRAGRDRRGIDHDGWALLQGCWRVASCVRHRSAELRVPAACGRLGPPRASPHLARAGRKVSARTRTGAFRRDVERCQARACVDWGNAVRRCGRQAWAPVDLRPGADAGGCGPRRAAGAAGTSRHRHARAVDRVRQRRRTSALEGRRTPNRNGGAGGAWGKPWQADSPAAGGRVRSCGRRRSSLPPCMPSIGTNRCRT
jgi:hypothetical protein